MPRDQRIGSNGSAKTSLVNTVGKFLRRWSVMVGTAVNIVLHAVGPLRIETVTRLNERADVFDITVPETHSFCLANGAVVHNSHAADAFRYGCLGMRKPFQWEPLDYGRSGIV
jgi:hypothetical protein